MTGAVRPNRFTLREVVGAATLGTALLAAALLRPAVFAFSPSLVVEWGITQRRFNAAGMSVDPWGNRWLRAPMGLHDSPLPIYSAGPNGVDDTRVYFDAQARFDENTRKMYDCVRLQQPACDLTGSCECESCTSGWAELLQLLSDLMGRSSEGPKGDDVFVRGERFERADLVFSGRLERRVALVGLILAWLLGARPFVARHRRVVAEVWRVLVMTSLPAVALTMFVSRIVRPPVTPLVLVEPEIAIALSAGAVCVIGAIALRARAPSPRPGDTPAPPGRRPPL